MVDGPQKPGEQCAPPHRPGDTEYQPLQTFIAQNVQPDAVATIQLSGGKSKPYYFSLGINSTVPFVQLEAAGGTQKRFSWGETVEVPPGQTVSVRNVSYMAGDIEIQSGREYAPTPKRIQKNVTFLNLPDEAAPGFLALASQVTVDLRRAIRAYAVWDYDAALLLDIMEIGFFHFNRLHTQETNQSGFFSMFQVLWEISPLTAMGMLPVGYGSNHMPPEATFPHVVGDYINIRINSPVAFGEPGGAFPFYVVIEY
jgi:hypothetical protein